MLAHNIHWYKGLCRFSLSYFFLLDPDPGAHGVELGFIIQIGDGGMRKCTVQNQHSLLPYK